MPVAHAARWRAEYAIQRARILALLLAAAVTWSLRGFTPDPRWLVVLLLVVTVVGVEIAMRSLPHERSLVLIGWGSFLGDVLAVVGALWVVSSNPADPIWSIATLIGVEAAARWRTRGAVLGGLLGATLAGWWATVAYAAEGRELSVESVLFRGAVIVLVALPAGLLIDQLRREQTRARLFYELSTELIVIVDGDGRVVGANPVAGQLLGADPEALRGRPLHEVLPVEVPQAALAQRSGGSPAQQLRSADGSTRWLRLEARPLGDGRLVHIIGHDVTQDHLRTQQLHHQASHDALTDLGNRFALIERLEACLDRTAPVGVLFLDLDGLKQVNDHLGHRAGDQLLVAVADRLREAVRASDGAYRLAGDEFCVVVRDADEQMLERLRERITRILARPLDLEGQAVTPSASIGLSLSRPDEDVDSLLARADAVMYAVKAGRENRREP